MDYEYDSDRRVIDEREPPVSPDLQEIDQNIPVTTPVPNETTEQRNIQKSADLPPVNYLPLTGNSTLNTIQNNMLNASEKPRITVKDFARIPDASSNENSNSALLTENSTSFQADFGAAVPMDLRAEVQNKDLRIEETWVHMNAGQASVVAPNALAYKVQNGNRKPHTQSAQKATVINPHLGNLSGGTMAYPPSTQHNGNTIPTAHNSRLVQDGQTQHMYAFNRPHNSPTDASAWMNYYFPGYPYSMLSTRPAYTLYDHPCNTTPPPSTFNHRRPASTNSHVMPANPHNVPSNGYGQYGTNSLPQAPYGHAKKKPGVKPTRKRSCTKISKNNTQVAMNNSEIPANNAMGSGVHNSNAIENEETTARKKVARPNKNSSKISAAIPVNNQVHAPPNIEIQQTRDNIEISSNLNLISDCTQPSMNNFPNVTQLPVTTETHLPPTPMRTNASTNIRTVSHFIDIANEFQPPMNTNNNKATTGLTEVQKGTMNMNINRVLPLMNAELAIINHNRDEQTPFIMDHQDDSAFIQPPHNNINSQDASTLLDNSNDKARTDVTASPKILIQPSSSDYDVNLTTSTTTTISHNIIERNEILRSNIVNTENSSLLDVERASSILNTVDYQTETLVKQISNISVETLKDILNKVQQMSIKTAAIVDQAGDNQVNKCDDTVNCNVVTNKIIATTMADDYIEARSDHRPQETVSKHNDKLVIARKKIATLHTIEDKSLYISTEIDHNKENRVAVLKSTDVRQSKSENSIHNDEYNKDNSQKEMCDIENQLSLIIDGVPSNSKKAKIDDQAMPNAEHVLDISKTTEDSNTNDFVVKLPINLLKVSTVKALMQNRKCHPKKAVRAEATLNISTDHNSDKEQRKNISTNIATSEIAEKRNRDVNQSPKMCVSERGLEVKKINEDATGTNTEVQNKSTFSGGWRSISANSPLKIKLQKVNCNEDSQSNITSKSPNNNEDIVNNKEDHTKKRTSVNIISDEVVTGINLESALRNNNIIVSASSKESISAEPISSSTSKESISAEPISSATSKESISAEPISSSTSKESISAESISSATSKKSISAEPISSASSKESISTEPISSATSKNTLPTSNSSDHNDRNVEGNRGGRKRISSDITNEERPNVTTNVSNNKHNDNTLISNRELSKTIETGTININTATTNTEANKSDSAKAPQVTPAMTEKDASRSCENQGNNDKRRNDVENNETNGGQNATSENREESDDKAQALENCFKTFKANCNSKVELPEVKIPDKKQKKTESKEHNLEDIEKPTKTTLQIFLEHAAMLASKGDAAVFDPVLAIEGLCKLAPSHDPPLDTIRVIFSSYHFDQSQGNRKRTHETYLNHGTSKKARRNDHSAKWSCEACPRSYSNKANLQRHVKTAHVPKRRLVQADVFECQECDYACATRAALDAHITGTHASTSGYKSPKDKCKFCKKELTSIYSHYQSQHKIEYPEEIMFDDGNVLVCSDINSENGKAPWFLKEREKLELYDTVTCRLCEAEPSFDNPQILLEAHYTMYHQVEPAMLDKLKRLFRAEKAGHLGGLRTSHTPKRNQCDTPMKEISKSKENTETHHHKASLKTQAEKSKLRDVFHCEECGQVCATVELLDKHKKDKHGPSRTSRTASKTGSKSNEDKTAVIEEDSSGLILYQCAECGVAATNCDDSVEHAQLHHLTGGFKPIPLTCDICNFDFEAHCIADHSTHHLHNKEYKIVKFHPFKLLDEWSEMFQGLSESHANRIKASSIYQYTRTVKMNCNETAGIPLYQCGKCKQYVRPKDVERHCYSKTSCVENQAHGHFCSDCERYFHSAAGLAEHEKQYKEYGHDWFRIVTFNCKEDETINRDIQKLQRVAVEKTPVKMQEKKTEPIKTNEILTVSKLCNECKKCIMFSEWEAHVATHNVYEDAPEHEPDRRIDAQNCIKNKEDEHSRGVASQSAAVETEGSNVDGVVEPWDSDNDSCHSLRVASHTDHADVHVQQLIEDSDQSNQVEMAHQYDGEIGGTGDVQLAGNSEVDVSSQVHDNITFDEFSEEMMKELKRDIQRLGFKEFDIEEILKKRRS